ncbi:MAG: isochorismatase family protein [Rubrivivax sp.]|nr:isochorismatase family protein [Rubrivivax sp.]
MSQLPARLDTIEIDPARKAWHRRRALILMRQRPEPASRSPTRGSRDTRIVGAPTPEAGDLVGRRTRCNGLHRTTLEQQGRVGGIHHLQFTCIAAEMCIESTARSAFFADVFPTAVEDAVDHTGPGFGHRATRWGFEQVFGAVTDPGRRLSALQPQPAGQR